jgi:hypothetical protein
MMSPLLLMALTKRGKAGHDPFTQIITGRGRSERPVHGFS